MNNKGITLVELIISFALLMVVVIGMLSIVMNVRNNYNERRFDSEMLEYKTTMTHMISKDLIKNELLNTESLTFPMECNTNNLRCATFNFKDEEIGTYKLQIDLKTGIISYGPQNNMINYPIPNNDFIEFLDDEIVAGRETYYNVELKVEDNFLIIDVPYFEIDKDKNYGFKIIHPIGL